MIPYLNDLITLVIYGAALVLIWQSVSTSFGATMILGVMLVIPLKGSLTERWLFWDVFIGQPSLVFSCLALALVHYRLGALAAHRVWRVVSVSLILIALILLRFKADGMPDHDTETIRLWASVIFQFVIIGGIGQAFWRVLHVRGFWRYAVTWLAFPASSLAHSFIAFHGHENFVNLMINSALCASYFGTILMVAVLALSQWLQDNEGVEARLHRSVNELLNGARN